MVLADVVLSVILSAVTARPSGLLLRPDLSSLWQAPQQLWPKRFSEITDAGEFPPVPRPPAADRRSRRPASAGGYSPYRHARGPGQDGALFPQGHRLRHAGRLRHHPLARARHHGARRRALSRDREKATAGDRSPDPAEIPQDFAGPRGRSLG